MSSRPRSAPTRWRALLTLALLGALIATVDVAHASDDDVPPPPAPATRDRWYGWQPLLADGAAVGLIAIGVARVNADRSSTSWFLGGIAVYALAAPSIHALHGRFGAAENDLALRLVLPIAGGLAGAFIGGVFGPQSCEGTAGSNFGGGGSGIGRCPPWLTSGLEVGSAIGAGIAVLIDAVWFARERVPAVERASAARALERRWTPTANPTRGGATLGFVAAF